MSQKKTKKNREKQLPKDILEIPSCHNNNPCQNYLFLLLILFVGFLSYSNTLHGTFIFDDIPNITWREGLRLDNFSAPELASLKQGIRGNRPVVMLSFALNYYFGKFEPFGFHIVNISLHLLTAILIYLLFELTLRLPGLRERYGKSSREIALLTGLLFVAHPIQTQAISYIVQRMTSMAAFFFMLALYCYVKAHLSSGNKKTGYYICCAIATLLALGSKEISVTLPLFFILYDYYFLRPFQAGDNSKKLRNVIIGLLLLVVVVSLTYVGFNFIGWLRHVYKKYEFSPGQRMLTQLRVILFYISLLLLPLPSRLNLDHDFSLSYSFINPPTTLLCFFFIVGLIAGSIYLAKKRPLISFALIWFWSNLVLESSFLPLELIYEHRVYLPSVGFFLLVSVFLIREVDKFASREKAKNLTKTGVVVALVIPLSFLTYQRNKVWQSELTIWQDSVVKSPNKARPHYNLANEYSRRKEYDKAISHYLKAIQIKPDYYKAHNNLGFCYFFKGDIQGAIAKSKTALQYKKNFVDAHYNLGIYYWNLKKHSKAREEFSKALQIKPAYEKARTALDELLSEIKK